jgi:eukaryotic-like serine/threonine-protein kinase
LFEETLKLQKAKLGSDHLDTLQSMNNVAVLYMDANRSSDAIPLFAQTLKGLRDKVGPDSPHALTTMNNLADAYLVSEKWTDAEKIARECLERRVKTGADEWPRFQTMSQLGAALAGQRKYDQAEDFLIRGYEGMKAREAKILVRDQKKLAKAAGQLVPFYEAWGKKDKADQWRPKLARLSRPTL